MGQVESKDRQHHRGGPQSLWVGVLAVSRRVFRGGDHRLIADRYGGAYPLKTDVVGALEKARPLFASVALWEERNENADRLPAPLAAGVAQRALARVLGAVDRAVSPAWAGLGLDDVFEPSPPHLLSHGEQARLENVRLADISSSDLTILAAGARQLATVVTNRSPASVVTDLVTEVAVDDLMGIADLDEVDDPCAVLARVTALTRALAIIAVRDSNTRLLCGLLRAAARTGNDQLVLTRDEQLAHARLWSRWETLWRYGSEQAFYDAIADEQPHALITLAESLEREGRRGEAEQSYRAAVSAGGGWIPRHRLVNMLVHDGRRDEAEQLLRQQMAAGAELAWGDLAELLDEEPGREQEVERLYRDAVAADPSHAASLADWLDRQGRTCEAEQTLRAAAASRDPDALWDLAMFLEEHGRHSEAGAAHRDAASTGDPGCLRAYGFWLDDHGYPQEADQSFGDAAATGDPESVAVLRDRERLLR